MHALGGVAGQVPPPTEQLVPSRLMQRSAVAATYSLQAPYKQGKGCTITNTNNLQQAPTAGTSLRSTDMVRYGYSKVPLWEAELLYYPANPWLGHRLKRERAGTSAASMPPVQSGWLAAAPDDMRRPTSHAANGV